MRIVTITEGTLTTDMVPQLNINKLIKNFYITEGKKNEGDFQNKEGDPELYLSSDCTSSERSLQVKYDLLNGSGTMNYFIHIEALKTNLGKGVNLFFNCPVSGKRAAILYYCFKSEMFIHRDAYPQRIYYPIQKQSKKNRIFYAEEKYDDKLFMHIIKDIKKVYRGKDTHRQKQIEALFSKRAIIDRIIYSESEEFLTRHERITEEG